MRRIAVARASAVLVALVISVGVVITAPADAGAPGPQFTNVFAPDYTTGDTERVTGSGCPATGAAPSNVEPGVVVAVVPASSTIEPGEPEIVVGVVTYFTEPDYPGMRAYYAPVAPDGTWSADIPILGARAPRRSKVRAICTTLVELTPDGLDFDAESLDAAQFDSCSFLVYASLFSTTTTTQRAAVPAPCRAQTTTTVTATTSPPTTEPPTTEPSTTVPTTEPVAAAPVVATPIFTG